MTTVRRIIAATAVAASLAVLPLTAIATNNQAAGGIGFGTDSGTVTTNGGQGSWPLKN
jgi:hypothetical protein